MSSSLEVTGMKCDAIYCDGLSWIGQYHAMSPSLEVTGMKYGVIYCDECMVLDRPISCHESFTGSYWNEIWCDLL